MDIKKISASDCSIYKLSEIIKKGVEQAMLSAVLGRIFIVGEENRFLGTLSVDHCKNGENIDMLRRIDQIQVDDINADDIIKCQAMSILSSHVGKYYGIIPLLDNKNVLRGGVAYIDDIWYKEKVDCLAKLEYLSEKKLKLESWFSCKGYKHIAFWGLDEVSLAFANELKKYSNVDVIGIYENVKLKPYIKLDYLNYEIDINFVDSISVLFDIDIDLLIICDWTMRHIMELPLFKKQKMTALYAPSVLLSNDRFINSYIENEYKKKLSKQGCELRTVRVPTEGDLKVVDSKKTMSLEQRLDWLARQHGWKVDSPELKEFNAERGELVKSPKKSGGLIYYSDFKGKYINYINKQRIVLNAPSSYQNTVYLIGPCIVSSMFNSDEYTLGFCLQDIINKNGLNYRVAPVGLPNESDRYYFMRILDDLTLKAGDRVFLFDQTFRQSEWDLDLLSVMQRLLKEYGTDFYYDIPAHCGKEENQAIAQFVLDYIVQHPLLPTNDQESVTVEKTHSEKKNPFSGNPQLKKYQEFIQSNAIHKMPKIGCIVMNCNPFTLGHRYLVEYAAEQMDYLYIFVVEEDKSYFKFEDRIELVKAGTSHLKNVRVLPSGQFIISSATFSEYFDKANLKGTTVDTSLDVEIFGSQIAPCLNISVRFVGEEPLDPITAQYNQSMKDILPRYGIELCEIPRKESGTDVISASLVRKRLEEKNWEEIKKLVPETTYLFLQNKYK